MESKFLGGDIQHTHLVKGLDYVLLDKASFSSRLHVLTCHMWWAHTTLTDMEVTCCRGRTLPHVYVYVQVRSEITSKEKEERTLSVQKKQETDQVKEEAASDDLKFSTALGNEWASTLAGGRAQRGRHC